MNVLTLIIKQEYFDKILSGEKKTETREIRPKTAGKYIYYENADTGRHYAPKDIDKAPESKGGYRYAPIQYDAIQLYVGYSSNRPGAVVKVKDAVIVEIVDENDKPIIYETDGVQYLTTEIVYTLGDVISRTNC